jgi:uncharacterized protein
MRSLCKISAFFLSLVLILSFGTIVYAKDNYTNLVDDADLLTDLDEKKVAEMLQNKSSELGFNLVIITTDTLGFSYPTNTSLNSQEYMHSVANTYCENYYTTAGFDYDEDGLVLVRYINQYDKFIKITSFGDLRDVFDEESCNEIFQSIKADLSGDSQSAVRGFSLYLDLVSDTYESRDDLSIGHIFIALIISLIISLIIVMSMKAKLKSVNNQNYAKDYLKKDSFKLTNSRDTYLYRTVSKVRIQSSSSSGGRSGGGRSGGGGGGGRG